MSTHAKRHLVLVGMMGSGKSTVAAIVGERLGMPTIDLDEVVEAEAGTSIAALFAGPGEERFRDLEADMLVSVLADPTPTIVATGGGAVLRPDNRTSMACAATVVWLRASPETLHARIGDDPGRPLLADDPLGSLRSLHEQRGVAYRDAADLVIDVDGIGVDDVAAAVVAQVAP